MSTIEQQDESIIRNPVNSNPDDSSSPADVPCFPYTNVHQQVVSFEIEETNQIPNNNINSSNYSNKSEFKIDNDFYDKTYNESIINELQKYPIVYQLFIVMGIFDDKHKSLFSQYYRHITLFIILIGLLSTVTNLIVIFIVSQGQPLIPTLVESTFCILDFAVAASCLTINLSLRDRFKKGMIHLPESKHIRKIYKLSIMILLYGTISIIPVYVFTIIQKTVPLFDMIPYTILQFTFVPVANIHVSLGIFVVLLDTHKSQTLMDKLYGQLMTQTITINELNETRKNIEDIWKSSNGICLAMSINFSLCVLFYIFSSFILSKVNESVRGEILSYYFYFAQYIAFCCFTLYHAVKINDYADNLTHKLARGTFRWNVHMQKHRLSLYVDSLDNPVSFCVGGLRLTKEQVKLRAGISLLSFFIGIVQSIVTSPSNDANG